ncbi:uncharacterized protein B0I36DRAFT_363500 [Microdochium trichocladiopsis]|uniref:Zn(2)-C6 fungal-type domain-containing protein n=1 Tax=Microdochium trichocladiopsis TaxID=1682393 RepID=A0A9P9BSI7_9PEZI|nr:uncharacterized protein B0I36DRAFT_363500 [Microdochium trichocladiopsis]KAH7028886.1 hypothetical protein B0I36DRAFT_363500 [Microdochium trichocladiopsis]
MSGLNLRPLLPAPRGPSTDDDTTSDSHPARRQNSGACDRCRSQKSRCDRSRPKCSLCVKRQVHCFYSADVKKQSLEVHKRQGELLHMMRTAPEDEALDILFRLRATADPQAVLESSRGNMSRRYQPSAIEAAQSSSAPTTFSALEFELSMRHTLPYPPMSPVDTASVDLKPITPMNGTDHVSPAPFDPRQHLHGPGVQENLCDDRLQNLDISYWTTVPLPSNVAARIISTYLQTNHPIWGLFHADLFVRDLVEKRLEFCSSFLVNALLCYACQAYGVTDPSLPALSIPFAQATEALWRAERSTNSVMNIAAILMFSLCCHTTNCGVSVAELMVDGRRMAEHLHLFGAPNNTTAVHNSFDALNDEWKRATAHIAWGAYAWMTINLYFTPTMKPIHAPPSFPIPGGRAADRSDWPVDSLPPYYGSTFTALCQLWTIMQEVAALGRG